MKLFILFAPLTFAQVFQILCKSWGMPPNRNFVVLWESTLTCEVVRRNSGISELKARVEAEVRPRPAYEKMEKET